MKKKLLLFNVILLSIVIFMLKPKSVEASNGNYNSYSYINVDSGRLLKDYNSKTIEEDLNKVRNKKMFGWNIYKTNSNVRVSFVKEALFSYKNEGSTPITYKLNITSEETCKTSCSATGSIGMNVSGGTKQFKAGLNEELKLSGEYSTTKLCKEQENLEIVVDPHTVVVGSIQGTGYYTNGVACYYFLWFENQIGAFEYFTITSSYLRIEKLAL